MSRLTPFLLIVLLATSAQAAPPSPTPTPTSIPTGWCCSDGLFCGMGPVRCPHDATPGPVEDASCLQRGGVGLCVFNTPTPVSQLTPTLLPGYWCCGDGLFCGNGPVNCPYDATPGPVENAACVQEEMGGVCVTFTPTPTSIPAGWCCANGLFCGNGPLRCPNNATPGPMGNAACVQEGMGGVCATFTPTFAPGSCCDCAELGCFNASLRQGCATCDVVENAVCDDGGCVTPTPVPSTPTPHLECVTPVPDDTCCNCGVFGCVAPSGGACEEGCATVPHAQCVESEGTSSCVPRACGFGGANLTDIAALNPTSLWAFDEPEDSTIAIDSADANPGTYTGNLKVTGNGVNMSGQGSVTTAVTYGGGGPQTMSVLACVRGTTGTIASYGAEAAPANALLEVSPAGMIWWGNTYGSGQFAPAPYRSQYSLVPKSSPWWPAPKYSTVSDGRYHLVVGTLGQLGQTTYLDGRKIGSTAYQYIQVPTPGTWTFGNGNTAGWPNTSGGGYIGHLHFAAFWNGTQLTDSEVGALSASFTPTPTVTATSTITRTPSITPVPSLTPTFLPGGCCQCTQLGIGCVQPVDGYNCNLQGSTPCEWFPESNPCPPWFSSPPDPTPASVCSLPNGSCYQCGAQGCQQPTPGKQKPQCTVVYNASQPCGDNLFCTTPTPTRTITGTQIATFTPTWTPTRTPTPNTCCQCFKMEGGTISEVPPWIACLPPNPDNSCPAPTPPVGTTWDCQYVQNQGSPCLGFNNACIMQTPTPTPNPATQCCECSGPHFVGCFDLNGDGGCDPPLGTTGCTIMNDIVQPCFSLAPCVSN